MRHLKSGRKFNKNSSHRKAMFRNMNVSLIKSELIKTTLAKAKELRSHIEPIITLAKSDSVHNRRIAFAKLRDKEAVSKLFSDLGTRFQSRNGGYVKILKTGFRKGDNAPTAIVEFLDRPESTIEEKSEELENQTTKDQQQVQSKKEPEVT